ncbi:MAG: 2-dehydropantoate 2-reductase [Bacteroidia bacterium]|nr:2-dehydropantoate 2-reductase [Bacteroidia bacterium]
MSNKQKIKAGIIGMGPVGMILAVHLQESGCDVLICDNDRIKINQIKNEGIKLENIIQKREKIEHIYSSTSELFEQNPDYVFIALKSYQVEGVLKDLPEANTSIFISAQNGIDIENLISEKVGAARTMRLVINFAGNLLSPNCVKVTFFNPPNYLACLDDNNKGDSETISELFNKVGLQTKAITSFELTRCAWEKTILNASLSPLCGIGRFTMAEAMAFPDTIELVEQIIEEAVEVAEAEKIRFPDDFIRICLRYLKNGGNHYPSLAGDLMNNRQTEIDYMNGKIVEYGRKHYIRTSLNLSMVNMVKAMTHKSLLSQFSSTPSISQKPILNIQNKVNPKGSCFLGIDLGSAYTKLTVIDENKNIVFRYTLKTLNRDKIASRHIINAIHEEFPVKYSCATGYGRKTFTDADIAKTEINCAAIGANEFVPGEKNILDIGGEDIKMIHCDTQGRVENFYLNDKCAAGTGAFLIEIAERAGIDINEMSRLAAQSEYKQELNSFCTVFAKTEIMKWIFDGQPIENLAKGIYLSIGNRIAKMRIHPSTPIVIIGGVIAHHPYLKTLLEEKLGKQIVVLDQPQHIVSFGAALTAREHVLTQTIHEQFSESRNINQKL